MGQDTFPGLVVGRVFWVVLNGWRIPSVFVFVLLLFCIPFSLFCPFKFPAPSPPLRVAWR